MIARLRGELIESTFTDCVIEAGGVGYEVLIPVSTFEKLPRPGAEATLLIHTQVREDAITLYGFATAAERDLFRRLIGVSGVGGKLALNILSGMPVETFRAAVAGGDVKLLSRISGIGKRTAERMVLELHDKLEASGGITLERLARIGRIGVDFVSSGALTHSVKAADISLDITTEVPS